MQHATEIDTRLFPDFVLPNRPNTATTHRELGSGALLLPQDAARLPSGEDGSRVPAAVAAGAPGRQQPAIGFPGSFGPAAAS